MNLVLRLLLVIASAFRNQSQENVTMTSSLELKVKGGDANTNGTIQHARYFSFADLGTIDFLMRSGILAALRRNGWSPIIVGKSFEHFKPITKGQKVDFTTRLMGWEGQYSCLYHQILADGEVVSIGHSVGRFVGKAGTKHPDVGDVAIKMGLEAYPFEPMPEHVLTTFHEIESARVAPQIEASK